MQYDQAHALARAIRESEEYQTYHRLKDEVMSDETVAALIKEYKKLQVTIQMAVMQGRNADADDMQRFSGINSLLFSKPEVSEYLMAEMRLQKMMAEIFGVLTQAAGMEIPLPV